MKKIKLALVGRPNVGKSALFNRICKRRIAIVDEAEGITRDRLYADTEFFGHPFTVVDTGGINPLIKMPFQEEVFMQTQIAMEEADILVLVVDAQAGVTLLDEHVAKFLLRTKKRVVLAVNKIDDFMHMNLVHPFYSLGISEIVAVSATQGFQITELLEASFQGITWPEEEEKESPAIKVAIVGRPNVGKSTLVNYLLEEQRCVVSPIAGTTRDSVDTSIHREDREFILIDTAGIRRKRAEHEVVDKFAALRTERAIERADICILVMDAESGMTTQEKRIADQIEEKGKACILLFNKWDLVHGFRMEHCLQSIRQEAAFVSYCPTLFVSAQTGRNLDKIFSLLLQVHEEKEKRISTGQLNTFIEKTIQKYHPPMLQGKRLRIYYMTQVQTSPPRFVLFVNGPELMLDSYKKYLMNQFREKYGFQGVPLLFELRGKGQRQDEVKPQGPSVVAVQEVDEELLEELPDLQEELDPSYY
ncbi:MAG: ribosome biogenesis GTPase Der [Chlamydiae bacterium]|nr:ribosome biogenesis GTPase Der [Chlamydiota bacterium]